MTNRYLYFNNSDEFQSFIKSLKIKDIGRGSEGNAFLTKDKKVIKAFGKKDLKTEEAKENIIMVQDYDISSYYFPFKLLIVNGLIAGYISDYFENNILKFNAPYNGRINDIDTDRLLEAYYKIKEDTKILSKDNILIEDLTFNLLFNNKKLGAIDTFGYYKDSNSTLKGNLETLDNALLLELHYHDIKYIPDYEKSIEYNLKRIKK